MTHLFRHLWSLALAAVVCLPLHAAAEPTIVAPTDPVPIGAFCDVTITGMDLPQSLRWDTVPSEPVRVTAAWGTTDPVLSLPTHKSRSVALILMWKDSAEGDIQHRQIPLVIGSGPGPEPDPDPDPDPNPAGFRVLILEETADRPSLPRGQLAVLMSPEVRTYLDSKGQDSWRLLDDDLTNQHMTGWTDGWKSTYAKAKELAAGNLPFVMVSNSTSGEAMPLPNTVPEMLTLLKKYGG